MTCSLDASMSDPIEGLLLAYDSDQYDNHYMRYIGGDTPLAVIKSSLKNGKRIAVVKESYGNAFAPYLMNHYEEVYIIDPRLFSSSLVSFIEERNIDDVIVVNYAFAISNTDWLNGFDNIIGYTPEES